MKQKVPTEVLEEYYELWLTGATASKIQKKLNLSQRKFNQYTPDFLTYCRHQVKFDTRLQMVKGDPPNLVELTLEREMQFLQLISTGIAYDKAALIMNVPLVTVLDYWFKNKIFKAKVGYAIEIVNARAVQSFYKRVCGYEYDGGYRTRTNGVKLIEQTIGRGDNKRKVTKEVPYHSETVVEKMNVIEPDVNAGKFWLFNRMPDEFTVDGQRTNRTNKGKILQWIEEQAELPEKKMVGFDSEQESYDDQHHRA